jgi:FolB domain-containing protein
VDRIFIKDLLVRGIVGINPDERENQQDVLVNVTLWADTRPAAGSDDIADAVNYKTISKAMIAHIGGGAPYLVERLAAELVDICFRTDDRIVEAEVSVEKPGALRFARSVGVAVRRTREEWTG